MSDLPQLSSQDIRAQLEKHYAQRRRHHLFAFFGTGEEATIDVANGGRFQVVPVQSELDLRDQLRRVERPGHPRDLFHLGPVAPVPVARMQHQPVPGAQSNCCWHCV